MLFNTSRKFRLDERRHEGEESVRKSFWEECIPYFTLDQPGCKMDQGACQQSRQRRFQGFGKRRVVSEVSCRRLAGGRRGGLYSIRLPRLGVYFIEKGARRMRELEPRRDCRRHFGLSHAAMAGSSSIA